MTHEKNANAELELEIARRADEMIFLALTNRERVPTIRDAQRLVTLGKRKNVDSFRLTSAVFRKTYTAWENYHKVAREDFKFWMFYTAICFLFAGIVLGFLAGTLF